MAEEKRDNSGVLFKNQYKERPTQPDMTGKVIIEGRQFRISAWDKFTEAGNPFLSLAFTSEEDFQKFKDERKQHVENSPNSLDNQLPEIGEDDIPF